MFYVVFAIGGAGDPKKGQLPRLSRQRTILVVKMDIYRPVGIRSGPCALLRSRILCLFGTFGALWRFVTWRRAVDGGQKCRTSPNIKTKRRMLFFKIHIYRSVGIRSYQWALWWVRLL